MDADNGGRPDGAGSYESAGDTPDGQRPSTPDAVDPRPVDDPRPPPTGRRPGTAVRARLARSGASARRWIGTGLGRTAAAIAAGTRRTGAGLRGAATTGAATVRTRTIRAGDRIRTVAGGVRRRASRVRSGTGTAVVRVRTGAGRAVGRVRTGTGRVVGGLRAGTASTVRRIGAGVARVRAGTASTVRRAGAGVTRAGVAVTRAAAGLRRATRNGAVRIRGAAAGLAARARRTTLPGRRAEPSPMAPEAPAPEALAPEAPAPEALAPDALTVDTRDLPSDSAAESEQDRADSSPESEQDRADSSPESEQDRADSSPDSEPGSESSATSEPDDEPPAVEPTTDTPDVPEAAATDQPTVDATEPDATEPDATEPDTTEPDTTEPDATEPADEEPAGEATEGAGEEPAGDGPEESTDTTRPAGVRGPAVLAAPLRWRAEARDRAATRAAERARERELAAARAEAARREALASAALRRAAQRREATRRTVLRLVAKERARRARRRRVLVVIAVALVMGTSGVAVGAYYVDRIPTPDQLALPESTTIYFSDGRTAMARLGTEHRTILAYDEMNDAVKQAIVAAEDRAFWTHGGVDLASVVRAAWNNFRGGRTQGASTITQQYARIAADLEGVTYARKAREALLAWKMDNRFSKEEILEFYLNTVPFGRGAYGIEAAAQAFFGKTVRADAPAEEQVTVAEAMVLASLVKQPEPDPADPEGSPGYDPARGGVAAANAVSRWEYIREGMVALGFLDRDEAERLEFPHTVRALSDIVSQDGLDRPTGLVVNHVLSELRRNPPFADQAPDYIRNGGFRIVTTIDKRAQDVAEAAADIRRATAPAAVRGQPANWQAALVAVEPGTGRVLAYYGGNRGTGADHAGWYVDEEGKARGFGQHPPGSTFKVYDLAEALRQRISLWSRWDSPASKEFPASGRTRGSRAGPVRNASSAPCQPRCMLWEAAVASLNVPFYALTERLGAANVIEMASRAGIESMWTDGNARTPSVRVDLRERPAREVVAASASVAGSAAGANKFWTEVGIGQYGITVLDHANGMATFAAGGKRAPAHFVREVTRHGVRVYAETITQSDIGLTPAQVDELTWTLSQVEAARLGNGWEAAGKTGTWQAANSTTRNAHTWMVGYTRRLAVAVWLGTTDGRALVTRDGKTNVFGANYPATIWRQFLVEATAALAFDMKDRHFRAPKLPATPRR